MRITLLSLLLCACWGTPATLWAQTNFSFSGIILHESGEPFIAATINWQGTTIAAVTNDQGSFVIERPDTLENRILEIHYVGYPTAQIEVFAADQYLEIVIPTAPTVIENVTVEGSHRGNFSSTLNPINIETISACELKRAACCSLAESFETNATVNVNYSDALTGAREIEMLGLRGTYLQMMIENRPTLNRLDRAYGMEYIPGTWIEAIQISKGASTVRNGVQSITGQINTEIIKPYNSAPFFINLYISHISMTSHRAEVNTHFNVKLSKKWSTGLLLHGNYIQGFTDINKDAFLDVPNKRQLNGMWRLFFKPKNWHLEWNIQALLDGRSGGQTAKIFGKVYPDSTASQLYTILNNTRRIEAFGKIGFLGFRHPSQSLALIYGGNVHEQNAHFGHTPYNALQQEGYANLIFQTALGHPDHNLTAGATYNIIRLRESYADVQWDVLEHTAGLYAEYSYIHKLNEDKGSAIGLIAGLRGDLFHTAQFTRLYPSPRLNFKYNINHDMVLRLSAGRGIRLPNTLMENMRYMTGQRTFVLQETILPEAAWNYGINYAYNFAIGKREGSISIDAYRTDFTNQLIADVDSDPDKLYLYNLQGKSFAHSLLFAYTQDLTKGLELRLAYKFNDVRMTYGDSLLLQPFSPQHRALMTLHYLTPKKRWQFNLTLQLVGAQRLPRLSGDLSDLPAYRQRAMSPNYVTGILQITHYFKKGWELYMGGENITNYTQHHPILGANNPFGDVPNARPFDATAIYGPVMGAMIYLGVRYTFTPKRDADLPTFAPRTAATLTIHSSIQCGTCEEIILAGMTPLRGIQGVTVDIAHKTVTVQYLPKETNEQAIRTALTGLGYDADNLPADPSAYAKLPTCCQKGGH